MPPSIPQKIWKKVSITVTTELTDPLADYLTVLTGRGVCYREEGGAVTVDAYLDPENGEDQLMHILSWVDDLMGAGETPPGYAGTIAVTIEEVPEEDWMSVFRSQHKTVYISDRLVVRPSWCEPLGKGEIVLDPGLAFGTGSHWTTRMCLVLLDKAVGEKPPGRMFDLGTGSGILAIAGAFLGIGEVLASDIDPVAVEITVENAVVNGVADKVHVVEGGVKAAEGAYGIVTANLSASLLKRLSVEIAATLEKDGALIISGFMSAERNEILKAFANCGLEPEEVMEEDVWAAALLRRQGDPRSKVQNPKV
jgi:ribosomal protein L11 methyltransferase